MMKQAIIIVLFIALCPIYYAGYKQGRMDKHDEMMRILTGNPEARIAIVEPKREPKYYPAGICADCHKETVYAKR